MKAWALVLSGAVLLKTASTFAPTASPFAVAGNARYSSLETVLASSKDKNDEFLEDEDLFKNLGGAKEDGKLGIDIGKMLVPLSPEDARALRAEAEEMIRDKVAQGVDDIQKLREDLEKELEEQRKERLAKSERAAQQASDKLMNKIDRLTADFLAESKQMRESTKLAAAADSSIEGKGVELGSWGMLGGASISTGFLGSVGSATASLSSAPATTSSAEQAAPTKNRIIVLADPLQDSYAKTLIPLLTELMEASSVAIQVVKPTQTMPLGGENAACVLVFATSLNDASSLKTMLERLLRKTLSAGQINTPPTQLVCVSTLGTERTNKMPYSVQNLLSGKLDKRRQIEEAIVNTIKQRAIEPSLDYTIIKLGELKDNSRDEFKLLPGDVLDGTTSPLLAARVLEQAIAFQPYARNATLCAIGGIDSSQAIPQKTWDEAFLKLDGPELVRFDQEDLGDSSSFDQLNEYLREWALLMESGKRALATPIRVAPSIRQSSVARDGVKERAGVRLLFLPTKTGSAYMSRSEERAREKDRNAGVSSSSSSTVPSPRKTKPEGGVEVLAEVTSNDKLRVRARRCNMADDTVLKELSEEMILKRLKDGLDVWRKNIMAP